MKEALKKLGIVYDDVDKKKREKFYDIAESFGVYCSYGEKIEVIRKLKSLYGQHTTLAEVEEYLWNERQRVEERIKDQL